MSVLCRKFLPSAKCWTPLQAFTLILTLLYFCLLTVSLHQSVHLLSLSRSHLMSFMWLFRSWLLTCFLVLALLQIDLFYVSSHFCVKSGKVELFCRLSDALLLWLQVPCWLFIISWLGLNLFDNSSHRSRSGWLRRVKVFLPYVYVEYLNYQIKLQ